MASTRAIDAMKVGTQEKLGFSWRKVQKGVYVECPDVRYRQEVFLPAFNEIRPLLLMTNRPLMPMMENGDPEWRMANSHYDQRLRGNI